MWAGVEHWLEPVRAARPVGMPPRKDRRLAGARSKLFLTNKVCGWSRQFWRSCLAAEGLDGMLFLIEGYSLDSWQSGPLRELVFGALTLSSSHPQIETSYYIVHRMPLCECAYARAYANICVSCELHVRLCLCNIILQDAISYCTIRYYNILWYTMICYTILWYTIIHYVILCYH